MKKRYLYNKSKRILDILLSLIGLLFFAPLILFLIVTLKLHKGSAIFRQQRPGLYGKPFTIYKFKTMRDKYDQNGMPYPDEQRITTFGKFLRSTSLDELPELWNVLKGDMSLVGPRPLLMEYLDKYTPEQARRHEVKPGITGWAQVNGRNALSWEERFKLDVWYVDNQSFWLDVKILFLTLWKVLTREGINEPGQATMTKFSGSNSDGL